MNNENGYWYCPHCDKEVSPVCVTYEENHTLCSRPVEWKEESETDVHDLDEIRQQAKELYPYEVDEEHLAYEPKELRAINDVRDAQRAAHVSCAKQYIDKVKGLEAEKNYLLIRKLK